MKKLKLQLDALRVESFETVKKARAEHGTVRGHLLDSTCASCPECPAGAYVLNGDPLSGGAAIVSTDQPMSCLDSMQDC